MEFLGNSKGENLIYDTWELTRIFVNLRNKYAGVSQENSEVINSEGYKEFLKIKNEFELLRAQAKQSFEQWAPSKAAFDGYLENITEYTGEKEINLNLLESLEFPNDSTALKARNTLVRWYKAGFTKQMVDLNFNSHRIRYQYKLNPDFDSRSVIGDDPLNFEDKAYGNSNVFVNSQFHGTTVSGLAGAKRNNAFGINGICENIEFMVVRTIPAGDERDKDVANAIYYAVDNGAKILNMSFGKPYSPNEAEVEKAIRYAEKNGVLLIIGSGNDGKNVDKSPRYPDRNYIDGGECKTWISVGSTTRNLDTTFVAPFSNYGKESVDLMAPGMEIFTLFPEDKTIVSEGTSLSSPIVTGIAALLWSFFPELDALELKEILLKSVTKFDELKVLEPGNSGKMVSFKELSKTGGVVNAYQAVKLAIDQTK